MSRPARIDPLPHLEAVARAMTEAGQPETGFRALDLRMGTVIGHKLFTVLVHHPQSRESERRYTNQPAAYPLVDGSPYRRRRGRSGSSSSGGPMSGERRKTSVRCSSTTS